MSSNAIYGHKSTVLVLPDRVRKIYSSGLDQKFAHLDPVLTVKSSSKSPVYYFRNEALVLELLSHIPDNERLPPKLYLRDNKNIAIEMERIMGKTTRDLLIENQKDSAKYAQTIELLPEYVATLHVQMNSYADQLIQSGRIKVRSIGDEKGRLWHYLRTIIYSLSPEMEKKRQKEHKIVGTINRDIKEILENRFSTNKSAFTTNFVDRDLYLLDICTRTETLKKIKGHEKKILTEQNLKKGSIAVIHGDLGPQHVVENGRVFDFDEVRLGSPITDLVALVYNTVTSPTTNKAELDLMGTCFKYLKLIQKVEPTPGDKSNFLIKLVETRLKEYLRIFSADCKASVQQLRSYTAGLETFDEVSDEELRQKVLEEHFVKGLTHFLNFYTMGAGYAALPKDNKGSSLYDQLTSISGLFTKLGIFEAVANKTTIKRLDKLLGRT